MTDTIQHLIDSLTNGYHRDPAEKIRLLHAALAESNAPLSLLVGLLRAPQVSLQLAAIGAAQSRVEAELAAEFDRMARTSEPAVRLKLAGVLAARRDKPSIQTLHALTRDGDPAIRAAAIRATAGRAEFRTAHENCLTSDPGEQVRLAAAEALEGNDSRGVTRAMFDRLTGESAVVAERCAGIVEARMTTAPVNTRDHLEGISDDILLAVEKRLKDFGANRFPALLGWITENTAVYVNLPVLRTFGTDMTEQAERRALPRAYLNDKTCALVMGLIQRDERRSVALVGEAGVGKSALVHELVYRLAKPENGKWRVLRMSPSDFLTGTHYVGEWETRVAALIEQVRKPRKVLLYVPNLSDLSAIGKSSKSDSNVASALSPYLEDGSVVILGESTPEEYERGLGSVSSLRRLFEKVALPETGLEQTRRILSAVRDEEKSGCSDDVLDELMNLSGQFLGHVSRPGNAVGLLRGMIRSEKETGRALGVRDVLDTLSRSTGIPADLLDDSIPLDEAGVRQFFHARIMGQPEAVDAIVDLVTMIKAGVTDPGKPFGVFLFVGPTGVGKTELARALAEFIFGDAARLARFDMSEYASAEGFTRLIGGKNENGLLTDAVHRHPFSVVLLDEIEKSHINVFDLCLQIFDAGRLTDGRGRTVDFRRSIIILTSNVGAAAAWTPPGFLQPQTAGEAPQADPGKTFRELSRVFRPEFLNRIDRILQFQPLTLEIAEQIARREVETVLQRSGIRRRQLVVDIDPHVISLLVKDGYSPHFGARPLKRTVERLLLLPLARTIAGGSLEDRAVLRLTENNGRVQAVVAATAARPDAPAVDSPSAPRPALHLERLEEAYAQLDAALRPLYARKSELILQSQDPALLRHSEKRTAVFSEIHNLDRFLELHAEAGEKMRLLREHPPRKDGRAGPDASGRNGAERLARDLAYLGQVARSKDARDLGDAVIAISLLERTGGPENALPRLVRMYQGVAARRRLEIEILGEIYDDRVDRAYLHVSGLGAYGLMRQESGLHQLERQFKEKTRAGRLVNRDNRELLRVEVHPAPLKSVEEFQRTLKTRISPLKPVRERLQTAEFAVSVFHEASVRSMEFWTPGPRQKAAERAAAVLMAFVQPAHDRADAQGLVRQYDIGGSPRIRDARSGRTTTRVKQVLEGDLDPLAPPEYGEPRE